jgi:hypothetical protein
MRDVELLVRYFAFRNSLSSYSGNLKQFLDDSCKQFNKDWINKRSTIETQTQEFEAAVGAAFEIFGENAFRKWDGRAYERRFNRAVFDVLIYYFSDDVIRKKSLGSKGKVKSAFEQLCVNDQEFLRSIETTTKSKEATGSRFTAWGKALQKTLALRFALPQITK